MTDIEVNYDNAVVVEVEVPAATPVVVDASGIPGDPGEQGNDGWSAVLANVQDGARRVQQVVNWIGGTGTPPAVGKYVGGAGYVDNIEDATDMRGAQGAQGAQGDPGAVIIGEGVEILTGEGPPDESLGIGNQLYLDTLSGDVWKKQTSDEEPDGVWTLVANIRGPAGAAGPQGEDGEQGLPGTAGWTPVIAIVNDGNRRVMQLADWTGGGGTKPGFIGQYVAVGGFTNIIANAIDIRGPAGADGTDGSPGLPGVAGSSVRAGSGAPSNGLGNNGDLYFDLSNGDLYGPKVGGAWGAPSANLTGPAGADGANGADGSQIYAAAGAPDDGDGVDGDLYVRTSNGDLYMKAAGSWGMPVGNIRGPAGPQGDPGDDGADGFSYLSGAGAPSNGFGNDGDSYLNTTNGDVYGPKAAGVWGSPTGNIRGPAGADGADGSDGAPGADGEQGLPGAAGSQILTGDGVPDNSLGANGDFYLDNLTGDYYQKAAGSWGTEQGNLRGPAGADGAPGADGNDGAPGPDGADGADGFSYLSGAGTPSDALGNDGDSYLNTTNGDVYSKAAGTWGAPTGNVRGPAGNDGSAGSPGAAGSQIYTDAGAPDDGDGADGDFYLNESNGDYYKKAAGTWGSPQGNLKGPQGDPGADGNDGAPGSPGANGNFIRVGTGVPGSGLGNDGDIYIDQSSGDLYGPKTAGAWGSPVGNLTGPAGADGADGADGSRFIAGSGNPTGGDGEDGDWYLNYTSGDLFGPKTGGAWGATVGSLKGPQGDPGADGADGNDGAPGADGTDGNRVLLGTVVPGGGTGNDGDIFIRTDTGDIYGPKTAGAWGSPVGNLTGPAGADAGDPLHYFRANKTVAQNGVSVSTPVFISWDTEDDPNGDFDISTGRWTPTAGGPILLVGAVQIAAAAGTFNAGTNITVGFRKNGSTVVGVVNTRVQAAASPMMGFAAFMDTPTPGDYYEMYVQTGAVSSGTTYNIQNSTGTFYCGVELTGSKGDPGEGVPAGGTTGQVLTKVDGTDYNTQWTTPSSGGSASGFKATIASNQTVSAGTVLAFATESYDTGSDYNNSTYRWTPPAGQVLITARCNTTAGATGLSLYKNGSLLHNLATTANQHTSSVTDEANGTDYYDIRATGSATVAAGITNTWFSGTSFG